MLLSMSFTPTYLSVLIKCASVCLWNCTCHHEKQSAAQDKGQKSNYWTLNMGVYAPVLLLCFNLGNNQIDRITDGCNYEKTVIQDYWALQYFTYNRGVIPGKRKSFSVQQRNKSNEGLHLCRYVLLHRQQRLCLYLAIYAILRMAWDMDLQVNEITSQRPSKAQTEYPSPHWAWCSLWLKSLVLSDLSVSEVKRD